jgi:hypothetical protein
MGRTCGEECPYSQNEPATDVGWQAWDVLLRCTGQLRALPGAFLGLDLAAALAVGAALGYDTAALAELLPAGEAGMVGAINERIKHG